MVSCSEKNFNTFIRVQRIADWRIRNAWQIWYGCISFACAPSDHRCASGFFHKISRVERVRRDPFLYSPCMPLQRPSGPPATSPLSFSLSEWFGGGLATPPMNKSTNTYFVIWSFAKLRSVANVRLGREREALLRLMFVSSGEGRY